VLRGELSPFRLEVERRPAIFWLDRDGEVFGRFFAAARWPRRSALQQGLDQAAAGAFGEAEAAWLAAFDEPVVTDDERWLGSALDVEASGRGLDTSLHLLLARLYLDRVGWPRPRSGSSSLALGCIATTAGSSSASYWPSRPGSRSFAAGRIKPCASCGRPSPRRRA